MPVQVSYPGIYVEEVASTVHTVTAVTTSSTAFVDFFRRGPMTVVDPPSGSPAGTLPTFQPLAYQVNSWSDFQRTYGTLDPNSDATYAAMQYFLNGGQIAWVVRVLGAGAALAGATEGPFNVTAISPGQWGNNLQVTISAPQQIGSTAVSPDVFNLTVQEVVNGRVTATESYLNLSRNPASPQYAPSIVNPESAMIRFPAGTDLAQMSIPAAGADPAQLNLAGGKDGALPGISDLTAVLQDGGPLDRIAPSVFNTLVLPATARAGVDPGAMASAITTALGFCAKRKAFYIVDIPETVTSVTAMQQWAQTYALGADDNHLQGAVYFPRLVISDPLNAYRPKNVAASGTMAGVYARIDTAEGVWKAPAGTEATLQGAGVAVQVTDAQNGQLNPLGINVLRSFPVFGNVSWGARTLAGADQIDSPYKYIPVRRLTNFIELSLVQSLKWVVFQPNDEALWANIRLEVGNFLAGLYSQGAFAGATAAQAYMVQCDATTTTQTDIDQGIVNILVGIAPVDPAEFVILQIQQIAGQSQ